MKIISHHKSHLEQVLAQGRTTVNGLTFIMDNGKATCYGAEERHLNMFRGVKGFSFHHDDGTHAGDSDVKRATADDITARLALAGSERRAEDHIVELIRECKLDPALLSKLMEVTPVVGGQQTGTDLNASTSEIVEQDNAFSASIPVTPVEQPQGENEEDDDFDGDEDLSDAAKVALKPRAELFGLAKRYSVSGNVATMSTDNLAAAISEAYKASKSA